MGVLRIDEYGKGPREVPIREEQVRIGRDPEGDVVLSDLGVSRSHARILRRENELLLEDLGSRNGTVINDRKLPAGGTFPLRDGDTIRVGRSFLKVLIRISRKIATRLGLASEARPAEATAGRAPRCLFQLARIEACLLVAAPGRSVVKHTLSSDRVRVGRDSSSDIVLDDAGASPEHAEIVYNREGFHLVDRDSAGGTFLDGVSIRIARLEHRSFIRFGKQMALFVLSEEGVEAPEASFTLRDRLSASFPEKKREIQAGFQDCRFEGGDFAAELILRGVLSPEEWWAATRDLPREDAKKASGRFTRILRRFGK
jgi:pSer/pThr/pTyr-binding forkhead associated (FHA) protein